MLHAMFHGNRSTGSGEEDFLKAFTIYGDGSHVGHVTKIVLKTFRSPDPWRLHIKFGYNWPTGFRGDVV